LRSKDCELIQIGSLLDDKGYGIGAPRGSPWVNIISNAILQLKTFGELPELYQKWWKKDFETSNCDMFIDKNEIANELGLSKLGGVFLIVAFGLCLSFIILMIELLWKTYQLSNNKVKQTFLI
jgi:glutamate receptor, ionotropic, invertebrate